MPDPTDNAPETKAKPSRGLGSYVVWAVVVVMVYVLSFGPVRALYGYHIMTREVEIFYKPVRCAASDTPLRKPLEFYFQLWDPKAAAHPKSSTSARLRLPA